jgi:hypothetical protein
MELWKLSVLTRVEWHKLFGQIAMPAFPCNKSFKRFLLTEIKKNISHFCKSGAVFG